MRSSWQLLSSAWGTYRARPQLYVTLYILPLLLALGSVFFETEPTADLSVWQMAIFFVWLLVTGIINILMSVGIILAAGGRVSSAMGAYRAAVSFFWRYLLLSILISIAVMFGFILLIIPGIILAVWFSQAYMIAILEDKGAIAAMKTSREYVKGKWWAIVWRIAFLILVMLLITLVAAFVMGIVSTMVPESIASVILLAANCIAVPLAFLYSYELYKDLCGHSTNMTGDSPMQEPSMMQPETPDYSTM